MKKNKPEGDKCYICEEGKLITKKVPYIIFGIEIGKFEAEVCSKCKEIFFDEETSKQIIQKTKELGLWGLESKTKVGNVGSALDIRLSKRLVDFYNIKKGEEVIIYPEDKNTLRIELISCQK
ncbi:MAG: hypothetical protein QME12_00995 [Nanoarchaeota archaeon]|nr:hypothetical protein [Nanoarchaeota archaeon]